MNTNDLNYFKIVYEEKGISQAAKRLFITPQGLSKTIKNLENEFGTVLFVRTQKGMKPTKSADFIYGKVEMMSQQLDDIENGIKQLENKGKSLKIGCAVGVMNAMPFQMIIDFMELYPEIEVQWCEYPNQQVKEKILNYSIDFGFIVGDYLDKQVIAKKITSRKIILLVYEEHPFFKKKIINIPMLKTEKLVTMNEQYNMYHEFMKVCMHHEFVPNIVGKTADSGFLYRLCKQKVGLAVDTDFAIENLKLEGVRAIPFQEKLMWNVSSVYRKDNKSTSTVRLFEKYIEKYIKN